MSSQTTTTTPTETKGMLSTDTGWKLLSFAAGGLGALAGLLSALAWFAWLTTPTPTVTYVALVSLLTCIVGIVVSDRARKQYVE